MEEGRRTRRTIGGKPSEDLQVICRGVSLVSTGAKTDPNFPAKKGAEPCRAVDFLLAG